MKIKNIILPEATLFHEFNYEIVLLKLNNDYLFKHNYKINYVLFSQQEKEKGNNYIFNMKNFYEKNSINIIKDIPQNSNIFYHNSTENLVEIIDDFCRNVIKQKYRNSIRLNLYKKLIKL